MSTSIFAALLNAQTNAFLVESVKKITGVLYDFAVTLDRVTQKIDEMIDSHNEVVEAVVDSGVMIDERFGQVFELLADYEARIEALEARVNELGNRKLSFDLSFKASIKDGPATSTPPAPSARTEYSGFEPYAASKYNLNVDPAVIDAIKQASSKFSKIFADTAFYGSGMQKAPDDSIDGTTATDTYALAKGALPGCDCEYCTAARAETAARKGC